MRRSRGTAKLPREFKVIVPIPYLVKYTFLNNYVSYFEICACPYIKYLQDQLKIKTVVISNDNSTPWTKNKRKIQWLQFLLSVVIFYCSSIFFSLSKGKFFFKRTWLFFMNDVFKGNYVLIATFFVCLYYIWKLDMMRLSLFRCGFFVLFHL